MASKKDNAIHVNDLEPEVAAEVRHNTRIYKGIKRSESLLKAKKTTASRSLLIVLRENGDQSIDVDGTVVSFVKGHTRNTLDGDAVKKGMLEAGVDPAVIIQVFDAATKQTEVSPHVSI